MIIYRFLMQRGDAGNLPQWAKLQRLTLDVTEVIQ